MCHDGRSVTTDAARPASNGTCSMRPSLGGCPRPSFTLVTWSAPAGPPINPAGNFNPRVFDDLSHERPVRLANFGLETLHHVHADDVAQAFERAVAKRDAAIGESFHVVSPAALTFRGYADDVNSRRR